MVLPKDVKPEDVMHPTGVFFRNPTHMEEADMAQSQNQIVKALTAAKREQITEVLSFTEESKPWTLPGFVNIREMDELQCEQLCRTMMRYRPNIFKVHIKLGNYVNAKPIKTLKTRNLSSLEPRFHTEVAKKMSDVLSDRSLNVTEIIYTVHSAEPGNFRAVSEVFGMVDDEDYENDELFTPGILIEYYSN